MAVPASDGYLVKGPDMQETFVYLKTAAAEMLGQNVSPQSANAAARFESLHGQAPYLPGMRNRRRQALS